jgi:hypothetical protein
MDFHPKYNIPIDSNFFHCDMSHGKHGAVSCDTHLSIIVESTNYRPKFVQSGNGSKRKEREREREKK